MTFEKPLIPGILVKRYKRFISDIKLESGETISAHCPNPGSMKSCSTPGWCVMVSESDNPRRKFKYTWEMVHNNKCWIGINTMIANSLVEEALNNKLLSELTGYNEIYREVNYGKNSRIDFLLKNNKQNCFVEVKNVSLVEDDGFYYFPDSVTIRGRKHLHELINMVKAGYRAVMLFIIQRNDGTVFKPAGHIDPDYFQSLEKAYKSGVEIISYQADVTPEQINIGKKIEWVFY